MEAPGCLQLTRRSAIQSLSLATARALALVQQGLHRRLHSPDQAGLLAAIRQLGLLQLDSIHVVARSHYLVMLSRVGLYDPADLDRLLYPDCVLFEHWAHEACLIPREDLPWCTPAMWARRGQPPDRTGRLGDDPQRTLDEVLAAVAARGPLASKDFADPRGRRGAWWDWKPAKVALEVLFAEGALLVQRRERFQRLYDLAERVLPESAQPPELTLGEAQRQMLLQGVRHLGVATLRHARDYYRLDQPAAAAALKALLAEEALVPVEVESWPKPAYLDPADVALVGEIEAGRRPATLTTLLAPFDNLLWHRPRLRELFGFDYRLEAYAPAARGRKYGYYVMPILHRGRLIGRLDPKADRASGTLIVQAIYLEPGEVLTDELRAGLARALGEFAAFNGCARIEVRAASPPELAGALSNALQI